MIKEMVRENVKWALLGCCVLVFMVYYMTPDEPNMPVYSFFKYSEVKLTIPSYWHYWAIYFSRLFFVLTLDAFSEFKYTKSLRWLAYLELLALPNYYFRYGDDFFRNEQIYFVPMGSFPYYFQMTIPKVKGFDMMTIRIGVWITVAVINVIRNIIRIYKDYSRKYKYDIK